MKKVLSKLEVFGHRSLACELFTAEWAMRTILVNLSDLRFENNIKFKKETLKKTERLYSEIRTLRESIGNEFQKCFEGQEKYNTARLYYAYRGETIEGIKKLFEYVLLILKTERGDSYQNDLPTTL